MTRIRSGKKEKSAEGAIAWGGSICMERKRNGKRSMDGKELAFRAIEKETDAGSKVLEEMQNSRKGLIGAGNENSVINAFHVSERM